MRSFLSVISKNFGSAIELVKNQYFLTSCGSLVVASILTAIYHMLKDGTMYQDLGSNHFDRRSTDQQKKRLVKRLADLGYVVEIKPLAA